MPCALGDAASVSGRHGAGDSADDGPPKLSASYANVYNSFCMRRRFIVNDVRRMKKATMVSLDSALRECGAV
jgi:hypothetical protein